MVNEPDLEELNKIYCESFADKQVVIELIKEVQIQKNILKKLVILKHNHLVDRVTILEKQNDILKKMIKKRG